MKFCLNHQCNRNLVNVMAAIVSLTPELYDPVVSRNGLLSILRRVYLCREIYKPIGVDDQSIFIFYSIFTTTYHIWPSCMIL